LSAWRRCGPGLLALHALRVVVSTLAGLFDLFVVAQYRSVFATGASDQAKTEAKNEKGENGDILHGFYAKELKKRWL